jgi:serine protease Do
VLSDGTQVALGTLVHADGFLITKASELFGRLECQLRDGRRFPAALVGRDEPNDVALLKIDGHDLQVASWSDEDAVAVGSWLATVGLDDTPLAIGVVSAPMHAVPKPRPVLGVMLDDSERGARVGRVLPGSPAAEAGLRTGDVIFRLNDQQLESRDALIDAIGRRGVGDRVVLSVMRDDQSLSITAILQELSRVGNQQQAQLMDDLGGPLSSRRDGFPSVVQHDSVLRPRDCGGPVVDLDGKVVGVNIARASRVASYALPASAIRRLLATLLSDHVTPVSKEKSLE